MNYNELKKHLKEEFEVNIEDVLYIDSGESSIGKYIEVGTEDGAYEILLPRGD